MSFGKALPDSACVTSQSVQHDHGFGQGNRTRSEDRVLLVAAMTVVVMLLEIGTGVWTGSMALLADGVHMGGHAVALGLAAGAYALTRRYVRDQRLSLGSGKINDLAAYTSAVLLGASTLWMMTESARRLIHPTPLQPLEALGVAAFGLAVNLASAWLLAGGRGHAYHKHEHDFGYDHTHGRSHGADHNLKAALTHVLADAATSVAAILGLIGAWAQGWVWLDPLIALLAALMILRWSWQLLRQTCGVLLDAQAPAELRRQVSERLEAVADSRITDLHLWSVGHNAWTLVASVVSHDPASPDMYKAALAGLDGVHHPMVEIHHCRICSPDSPSIVGMPR